MLIPLTVYLYRRDGRFAWLVCGGILTLGALASGSRTAALMLIALLVTLPVGQAPGDAAPASRC